MIKIAALSALSFALLGPAAAVAADRDGNSKTPINQNKVVCRSQESTGSRLAQVKRCQTLAEWAQEKQANRLEIERIQNLRTKSE